MTTPPIQDEATIDALAETAIEEGKQKHREAADKWEKDVNAFLQAAPAYNQDIAAWNDWVLSSQQIQSQWESQVTALAEWEEQYGEAYRQAQEEREEAIRLKTEATEIWEELVALCEVNAQNQGESWSHCRDSAHLNHMDDEIPDIPEYLQPPKLWPNN